MLLQEMIPIRNFQEFTVRVEIITGGLAILENRFPPNYRYRYGLEIRMNSLNYHYRYRLGVRSHPFEFGICSRDSHRSLLRRCTFLSSNSGHTIPLYGKEPAHYNKNPQHF